MTTVRWLLVAIDAIQAASALVGERALDLSGKAPTNSGPRNRLLLRLHIKLLIHVASTLLMNIKSSNIESELSA